MIWLLQTMVTNAVLATILAVIVFVVTRFVKKPAVVYWLWVLVLVKLATPPVLHLPLRLEILDADDGAVAAVSTDHGAPTEAVDVSPIGERSERVANLSLADSLARPDASVVDPIATNSGDSKVGALWKSPGRWPWVLILGTSWILGSSCWFALAAIRVYRFERLLRQSKPASAWLRQEADALAERLGLGRCPQILVVHGRVPPLLWSMRRSSIVAVPSELLDRMEPAEQLMVIAHELAHFCRRDHWFRFVEMTVLGVYFWHPVAWLARRQLQEAEEHCCDAWVLWAYPENPKSYARALLSTIEFLSAPRTPLPAGASGFGARNNLQRRFEMILQNRVDRRISWLGKIGLLLFACVALGLSAHIVLAEAQESEPAKTSATEPNVTVQIDSASTESEHSDANHSPPAQSENEADLEAVVKLVNTINANKAEYQRLAREQRVAVEELNAVGVSVWQYEPNHLGKLSRQLPAPIRDGFQSTFKGEMFSDVTRVSIRKRLDAKELEYVLQRLKSFPQLKQLASLGVALPPEQIQRIKEALPNVQVELPKVIGSKSAASQAQLREYAGVQTLGGPDKDGMVKVTFQPSPHSTMEKLIVGQEVFVSQTLRPISPGFDHTPVIAEGCKLVEFWKDHTRPASNQPVVLLVKQRDVDDLQKAEEAGALEVHAAFPALGTAPILPQPVKPGES